MSSDFEFFSPKMHALVNYLDFALDRLGVVSSAMKRCLCLKEETKRTKKTKGINENNAKVNQEEPDSTKDTKSKCRRTKESQPI